MLAEQPGDRGDLRGDLRELLGRELLWPVAESLVGLRVHLDEHSVRAHRGRSPGQRWHQLAPPGGVRRIDDYRQVRLTLEHRDGPEIECVARAGLERLDPTLAEHDLLVSLLRHALCRHQQLVDGSRGPALDENGLLEPADLREQAGVLHVARPDLDHVCGGGDFLDVAGVEELGHDRQPRLLAGFPQDREPFCAQPLEGVGRGARLECATAQHRGARVGDGVRGCQGLFPRFDGAGPCDEPEVRAPDPPAPDLDHGRVHLAADERQRFLEKLARVGGGHRGQSTSLG